MFDSVRIMGALVFVAGIVVGRNWAKIKGFTKATVKSISEELKKEQKTAEQKKA